MEALNKPNDSFSIFTSSFNNIEIADDHSRAILIIPLMHVGANKKGLFWTAKMLKKIAPMFRSVPYRYDLQGSEGSSHTLNKLSSPHFDVGWSYSSDEGAWYDPKTKSLWTKGEVTHPDVIAKLSRMTSDGKREVNFASMGVIVEKAVCSLCGSEMEGNTCENNHERNKKYDEGKCYKVPTEVSKALHIALTNDPADGEAKIENVLIQELGDHMNDEQDKKKPNNFEKKGADDTNGSEDNFQTKGTDDTPDNNTNTTPAENRDQAGQQMDKSQLDNQIPGGLAPSSPQTAQPGEAPSAETILRDLAERIKTIEGKVGQQELQTGTPELVNSAPQDQFVQDNMGNTSQFDASEENKMDVKDGQTSNEKTVVNPEPEMQDQMGDPMQQIMGMLQQILSRMGGAETQDMGKEALSANKSQAKKAQDDIATEHLGEGTVGASEDEGNAKNKANMMKPGSVATADDSTEVKENTELADLTAQVKALRSKLEVQDNNVPEFGGSNSQVGLDVADMGANGRTEKFGDFGKWDACFNGANSAQKFVRDM